MRIPAVVHFIPATLLLCSFFMPAVDIVTTGGLNPPETSRLNGFQAFTVSATDDRILPKPIHLLAHLWVSFCCILVLLLPFSHRRPAALSRALGALLVVAFFTNLLWSLHLRVLAGHYVWNSSFLLAGVLAMFGGLTLRASKNEIAPKPETQTCP